MKIVSRQEWGARPPDFVRDLVLPVANVVLKYFTFTKPCAGGEKCYPLLRKLQTHGMDILGFNDIEYNFLVGRDGTVYEGRGWFSKSNNYHQYNGKSIDIAYIGDHRRPDSSYIPNPKNPLQQPTHKMVLGARNLIKFGIENKYIISDYNLFEIKFWDWSADYGWKSPLEEEDDVYD